MNSKFTFCRSVASARGEEEGDWLLAFWSDKYIQYLDCGSGYMMLYICENLSNYILKTSEFYCIYIYQSLK